MAVVCVLGYSAAAREVCRRDCAHYVALGGAHGGVFAWFSLAVLLGLRLGPRLRVAGEACPLAEELPAKPGEAPDPAELQHQG
jgi:hypothetical protein